MRVIFAALLALAILGLVQGFVWFQAGVPMARVEQFVPEPALGEFAMDVTLTFDAEPDPFDFEARSLLVRRGDEVLLERTDRVPAGRPIRIDKPPEMAEGLNEFFVVASVPEDQFDQVHAVRVRVLRDGAPIAERTLWSAPGEPVQGLVAVQIPSSSDAPAPHGHEAGD